MFDIGHLNDLRAAEIEEIAKHFPVGARVLEIGAGTGKQALELKNRGFDVEAIEIASSHYSDDRIFPIVDFDGRHIPFPDASFDIAFSSNVLEHIPDLTQTHAEIARILKPTGYAVHVLPTHVWRFWTTLSAFPTALQYAVEMLRALRPCRPLTGQELRRFIGAYILLAKRLATPVFQRRHGERGNVLTEIWYFRPEWWRRNFRAHGFEIAKDMPMGFFYTGNMTFGPRWSIEKRQRLAASLGSACHLFIIRPVRRAHRVA